jgi:hypothetical protein
MDVHQRIKALARMGKEMLEPAGNWQDAVAMAARHNPWFTPDNIRKSIQAIANNYLAKEKLEQWIARYDLSKFDQHKLIGVVTAGNIPLVGIHDVLAILVSGNICQLKLSDKDNILMEFFLERIMAIEPRFKNFIQIKHKLEKFDGIICTGSNNTARYFEHYFGKYKHIIRRNRNSVAILSGDENEEDLVALGSDVFTHFGMGCRNVSKIFVPKDFDLLKLKPAWDIPYGDVMLHHKYKHNLDYQRTVYLMNQIPMLDIDFINIVENPALTSPIACLYYERYNEPDDVDARLKQDSLNIQCVTGKGHLPFGTSQEPELWDYADGVDTMDFILHL